MLPLSFLIESSLKLLVTRTGIKVWMSLILGRIRPLTLELNDENFTLSNLNISEASWPVLIILYVQHHWGEGQAAQGFGADWIKTLVSMATESPHWLIMGKMVSPVASLDQILWVASLGVGKGCIMFWLDKTSGVHGNRKPPLTYKWENGVSTFSRLLLVRFFLYLHVMRTCIKSRTSSNFGQIGQLTMELAALECLKIFP